MDLSQFNPKLGITWNPFSGTTLRAAGFRVLKKMLIADQTLEPTQVAGFNQFYDDGNGTGSWRYGIALDQKITKKLFLGTEFSERDMKEPIIMISSTNNAYLTKVDLNEKLSRSYLYWTPFNWLAISTEYHFEQFIRDPNCTRTIEMSHVKTHRFPLGINLFHSSGLSSRVKITYFDQKGDFGNKESGITSGEDHFWVVDAFFRYRFPERSGFLSIEGKNIFNQKFNYQNVDLTHPLVYPKRLIMARFTVGF